LACVHQWCKFFWFAAQKRGYDKGHAQKQTNDPVFGSWTKGLVAMHGVPLSLPSLLACEIQPVLDDIKSTGSKAELS
jgi:hypothetical protein